MSDNKKIILKEIDLWKKRFGESKKRMRSVVKDVKSDLLKAGQEVLK